VVIATALVPGPARAAAARRGGRRARHEARFGGGRPRRAQRRQLRADTRPDEEVVVTRASTILGPTNLASDVPLDASRMFSRNVVNLVSHLVKEGKLALDREDEITKGTLVTHGGEIVHPVVQKQLAGA
jgi:hypothetical protein